MENLATRYAYRRNSPVERSVPHPRPFLFHAKLNPAFSTLGQHQPGDAEKDKAIRGKPQHADRRRHQSVQGCLGAVHVCSRDGRVLEGDANPPGH